MAGFIQQRGERKWLVRVYLGIVDGKKRYLARTVYGTRKEAERELRRLLALKDERKLTSSGRMTVNAYLDEWLRVAAAPRVRPATAERYAEYLARYVRPVIGSKRLDRLTPLDVQTVYAKMQERGLSARTVRYTHAVLHSALKQAVRWRLIPSNPAEDVDLPRVTRSEMKALDVEGVRRLLEAARSDRLYALWLLLATCGLRPSEALALKWEDFDPVAGTLRVERALTRPRKGGGWSFEDVKRPSSRRTIQLPAAAVQALKEHRKRQAAERLFHGPEWQDHGLIFTTSIGTPLDVTNLNRAFKRLLKAAGLPDMRLYDLRHTTATLLVAAGTHPRVAAEMLGHSPDVFMNTYSHVLPGLRKEAADRMEALVFAPEKRAALRAAIGGRSLRENNSENNSLRVEAEKP